MRPHLLPFGALAGLLLPIFSLLPARAQGVLDPAEGAKPCAALALPANDPEGQAARAYLSAYWKSLDALNAPKPPLDLKPGAAVAVAILGCKFDPTQPLETTVATAWQDLDIKRLQNEQGAAATQGGSASLSGKLEKFRADQHEAPTYVALSAGDQHTIAGEVRACYPEDTEARNDKAFQAHLTVTVDSTGEARTVEISTSDQARVQANPAYRTLAERAQAAVMNPACSKLPLPASALGRFHQIEFVFRP